MSRVLVADRCADTVESLVLLLRFWGHEARGVSDGPSVLEAVRAYQPDLVVMDLALPRMDGYKVARHLRQQHDLDGLLLVAVTGFGGEAYRRAAYEAGFDFYLVKPVAPPRLQELLGSGREPRPAPPPDRQPAAPAARCTVST